MTARERFFQYSTWDTTSDSKNNSSPSSPGELIFARELTREMIALGLADVCTDAWGNVIGTLPTNIKTAHLPVLGLIAHMDTSEEENGKNIRMRKIHFTGQPIKIPGMAPRTPPPDLAGQELLITDGTTLLGADDKAGIAEILTAVEILQKTDVPHGEIRIVITSDEEIGRGTQGLDVKRLGCAFAYTVDGGPIGEIQYENFNAANAVVTIHGTDIHPGMAKGVMVNASSIAAEFHALLPRDEVPEKTEGYQGFFHLLGISGTVTGARLYYLIREHNYPLFEKRKQLLDSVSTEINRRYGAGISHVEIHTRYLNMREKMLPHMHLIQRAEQAFRKNGISPHRVPIRGCTDGVRLTFAGLPCPNLSTGGYNFHSTSELIPVKSLEIMSHVLCEIAESFTRQQPPE